MIKVGIIHFLLKIVSTLGQMETMGSNSIFWGKKRLNRFVGVKI